MKKSKANRSPEGKIDAYFADLNLRYWQDVVSAEVGRSKDLPAIVLASLETLETASARVRGGEEFFLWSPTIEIAQNLLRDHFGGHQSSSLIVPSDQHGRVAVASPTNAILKDVLDAKVLLPDLNWRQFEELIADLLARGGFEVTLGPGRKDQNVDILAIKKDPVLGQLISIWQAKRYKGRPVGIEAVRELAYTTQKFHASKGMLVTTTRLTKDAICEIELLGSLIGKKDHDEVLAWMKSAYRLD